MYYQRLIAAALGTAVAAAPLSSAMAETRGYVINRYRKSRQVTPPSPAGFVFLRALQILRLLCSVPRPRLPRTASACRRGAATSRAARNIRTYTKSRSKIR